MFCQNCGKEFIMSVKSARKLKKQKVLCRACNISDTKANITEELKQEINEKRKKTNLENGTVVMTTRYCLRRELGACLKAKGSKQLPSTLFLRNGKTLLQLNCDCSHCEMTITIAEK